MGDTTTAHLECFFCRFIRGFYAITQPSLLAGNRASSERRIERGGVNVGNPTTSPLTKREVPNGLDLDLFAPCAYGATTPPGYRGEAEFFAWCLIFICICVRKGEDGQIYLRKSHPPPSWFRYSDGTHSAYSDRQIARTLETVRYHEGQKHLASLLHDYWVGRCLNQIWYSRTRYSRVLYEESSDRELFEGVLKLYERTSRKPPELQAKFIRDRVATALRSLKSLE